MGNISSKLKRVTELAYHLLENAGEDFIIHEKDYSYHYTAKKVKNKILGTELKHIIIDEPLGDERDG